jgi:hypothetical protein
MWVDVCLSLGRELPADCLPFPPCGVTLPPLYKIILNLWGINLERAGVFNKQKFSILLGEGVLHRSKFPCGKFSFPIRVWVVCYKELTRFLRRKIFFLEGNFILLVAFLNALQAVIKGYL